MKITRYPQSCLLLEHEGRRLVIDPGMPFMQAHQPDELGPVEAVLITHEHFDHMDNEAVDFLLEKGATVVANASAAKVLGEREVRIVDDGEQFELAGFTLTARELPHCLMPDGSPGPQNTGYLVNGVLFHPGDGKELSDLTVDTLALPIQGPDISFHDSVNFAKQVSAKLVIPIHFDLMGANPQVFKHFVEDMPFEVRVLGDGESLEIATEPATTG